MSDRESEGGAPTSREPRGKESRDRPPQSKPGARKLSLWTLFEWVAGLAILAALVAAGGERTSWTTRFSALPANDSSLRLWLLEHSGGGVRYSREGDQVTLASHRPFFRASESFASVPRPPWDELGYRGAVSLGGGRTLSLVGGAPRIWLTAAALLVCLAAAGRWLRRGRPDYSEA